jgi:uncharacterized oligopeptide transporter (OPT) family protein
MSDDTKLPVGSTSPGPRHETGLFSRRYREVTVASIVFGVVCGAIMNASITYAGLKIGFTIVGSSIAAVLGFGVLRGLLRRGSILEINIAQTIGSAVNVPNSGVIFTVPVLLLLGYRLSASNTDFWLIMLACVAGAILGTCFIIPLRKQMIDIDRLRFPSPTGVAIILKAPGAGPAKALVLVAGVIVAMLLYAPAGLPALGLPGYGSIGWRMPVEHETDGVTLTERVDRDRDGKPDLVLAHDRIDLGRFLRLPDQVQVVFALAPFAIGAGFITGRPGLMVLAGGVLAYFVLNPLVYQMGWVPETIKAHQAPGYAFNAFNRPLGIGLLLGGALMGVLFSLPAIAQALKSIAAAGRARTGSDELGLKVLVSAVLVSLVLLFVAADFVGNKPINSLCPVTGGPVTKEAGQVSQAGYAIAFSSAEARRVWTEDWTDTQRAEFLLQKHARPGWLAGLHPHARAALIALVGAAWIWFAGIIIAQCTGMTDWSPISGMALVTVVLVMLLAGSGAVVGAVLIGAALCVAITVASDMMGDLKTGYLVGAQPRRQQIVELATTGLGPVICMFTLLLIVRVNQQRFGIPIGPGTDTVAPQAQALQAVITGVQGGEMPYALYGLGAALGALLGLGAFPGLGVLVGLSMYLPFLYVSTYGIGCVLNMIVVRLKGQRWSEEWGVPFAAGLIVGEAILALLINMLVLLKA